MPYAIELFFDEESESRVRSLWEKFASFGAPEMRESGARPHISLAVCDSLDVSETHRLLSRFASLTACFPISLSAFGLFPGSHTVAYLAPKVTSELLALQARLFEELTEMATNPWRVYSPECWMPHCTLATSLSPHQLVPAVEACNAFALPVSSTISAVGLVAFRPVEQLYSMPLSRILVPH